MGAFALTIVHCEAPLQVLRERLLARQGDASEANLAVLEQLRARAEPLAREELTLAQTPAQLIRSTDAP